LFKGLANLAGLMKQVGQISGKMQAVQDELKAKRIIGSSGAGMVEVEMNGLGEMLRLTIDPKLIEGGEREMIEDLIPAAVNEAQVEVKRAHGEAMRGATEGLGIPGIDDAIAKMTGAGGTPQTPPTDPPVTDPPAPDSKEQ
jgi:DNA-binding YbaB/EbfC family protein